MPQNRKNYLDVLRVASMFAVIYLHVAAPALRQFEQMPLWYFSNFMTALCTAAVPIFFMISGALLLSSDKTADPRSLLQRLPHILIPLLLWSLIAVAFSYYEASPHTAFQMLWGITGVPVITPYWFVYALLPLYLFAPLLKRLLDAIPPAILWYALGLWLVFTILIPTIRVLFPPAFAPPLTLHTSYNLDVDGGFAGYFLLGYVLDQMERLPRLPLLCGVIAVDLAVIVTSTWARTIYAKDGPLYNEQFKSYLSVYVVVLSVSFFLLARVLVRNQSRLPRALGLLSGASYCVYLAHPRMITLLHGHVMNQNVDSIPAQLLFYGLAALPSLLCAFLLASVKPLCWPLTGQRFRNASNIQALFHTPRHKPS